MKCSFEEIGHLSVTFPDGDCTVGAVCKLNTTGQAVNCAAGDRFCGVVEVKNGGCVGVQIHGFANIVYTSTAPTVGYANLVANGNGGVKVDNTNGKSYFVVAVDTASKTATIEL